MNAKKWFLLLSLIAPLFAIQAAKKSRRARGKHISTTAKKNHSTKSKTSASTTPPAKKSPAPQPSAKPSKKQKPAAPHQTTKPPQEEKEEIFFNFDNVELKEFLDALNTLKGITLSYDEKTIAGSKVSLRSNQSFSKEHAWRIMHTILDMAGFALTKRGEVHLVVPKDKKLVEPLPNYINVSPDSLPQSDQTIRYIAYLKNIKVQDVQPLLDSMLSSPHLAVPYPSVNGMVIADTSYNIKAAMRIVQELDKVDHAEEVSVIQLHEANATEVRDLFKSLMTQEGGADSKIHPLARRLLGIKEEKPAQYFSPSTKIIAEDRTNSLILLGTHESINKISTFIKEHVDTSLKDIKSPLHIYELQYADAKQVADILKEVTTPPDSTAGQQAAKYGAIRGGVKYFGKMTFKADPDGNRLIVAAQDDNDWELLRQTIENLDKPQPQVAIEALVALVTVDNDDKLGGQTRNKKNALGKTIDFQAAHLGTAQVETGNLSLRGNLLSALPGELGSTLLTFGKGSDIWSIFRMLQSRTHTSVVAQPFLTVANKYKANINIGTTKRQTSSTATDGGATGQQDTSANLKLEVTPQINVEGVINLALDITFDEFENTDASETTNRKITTNVSVADGQVIALGGLVKTKVTHGVSRTPLLGSIPVLGWMFKNKTTNINKTSVLIFLNPTIQKPRSTPGIGLYSRMKLHDAKDILSSSSLAQTTRDPIHQWFFSDEQGGYAYKVDDYATARYQPVMVDMKHDPFYRQAQVGTRFNGKNKKQSKKPEA